MPGTRHLFACRLSVQPICWWNGRRVLRSTAVDPPAQHPLGHFFTHEGEGVAVAPVAVDVDVPATKALIAEPELLDDPEARLVLGTDADLHPVQPQLAEADVGGERDGCRRDAAARESLAHPVADGGRRERPPGDPPHV